MPLTFIHTADWQIGRPFRSFDDRLGGLLEEARLSAIETIADVARGAGARHVLVAGDVFDAETLARKVLMPAIERMCRNGDLNWHLLPGNHDPARPGGLWHRLQHYQLPANVRPLLDASPVEIEPGAFLLPAPLRAKGRSADPTAWMDQAATPTDAVRIGLAHGSIYDFAAAGTDVGSGGNIDPARMRKAGLDYLALGDWHGMKRIDAGTWYAGTPEPDRFGDAETGPAMGQVLHVTAAGGRAPEVSPRRTGRFVWAERQITISHATELASLEAELLALAPATDRLLLRLSLAGTLAAGERAGVMQWGEQLEARLRYLSLDASGLTTRTDHLDLTRQFSDPRLAEVAARLSHLAASGEIGQRRAADRALVRLGEIVRADSTGELPQERPRNRQ